MQQCTPRCLNSSALETLVLDLGWNSLEVCRLYFFKLGVDGELARCSDQHQPEKGADIRDLMGGLTGRAGKKKKEKQKFKKSYNANC